MDLLKQLSDTDIYNISKICNIINIYDKTIDELILEIISKRNSEISKKTEIYFGLI